MPMLGGEKLADLLRHPAFVKGPIGAKARIILAGKGAGSGLLGKSGISHCDGGFVGAKALTFGGTLWKGLGLGTVGIGLAVVDWMPLLVVAVGAATVFGYLKYRKASRGQNGAHDFSHGGMPGETRSISRHR